MGASRVEILAGFKVLGLGLRDYKVEFLQAWVLPTTPTIPCQSSPEIDVTYPELG